MMWTKRARVCYCSHSLSVISFRALSPLETFLLSPVFSTRPPRRRNMRGRTTEEGWRNVNEEEDEQERVVCSSRFRCCSLSLSLYSFSLQDCSLLSPCLLDSTTETKICEGTNDRRKCDVEGGRRG